MHASEPDVPGTESRLRPGDTLGRYQLLVPVGAGGMGRVWAARALGPRPTQRLVAIKTALGNEQANQEFKRRFMDEARIASLIQHPNVCSIHTLDEEDGILYLVMDWSDGATLRELLDAIPGHRLEPAVAARIVARVAAGLHAAHELEDADGQPLNVVHRDVSPQNVLLSAQGYARIADFGVAKARGQLHQATETGEVKGKLSYMAPEQVTSKNFDRRVDVFALGCVLYEATVGRRPFQGDDALATLYQLLERPLTRPAELCSEFPEALEAIVVRALAKDVESRYQTAAEMEHALEAWIASTGRVVTERDIELVLKRVLGGAIDQRNERIQETVRRLERREPVDEPSRPVAIADTNSPSVRSLSGEPTLAKMNSFWTRTRVAFAMLALLATGALVLGGVARSLNHVSQASSARPRPADSGQVATQASSADPGNEPPRRVVVTLRAAPSAAKLFLDGEPVPNPYAAHVTASGVSHSVRASAAGHREQSETVVFDRDRAVVLDLVRIPVATAVVRAASKKPAPRTAADAGRPPDKTQRKPRVLDPDNPFATP
ncbi:MAG: serine/threonine protein kinase [Polyangiaceae bacterium]|nr:serine/threonine protein kinase [Polyangiaceae bacterium]